MRMAWAPSPVVATTSKPASLRSRLTESRHIGWSSTTMTRVRGSPTAALSGISTGATLDRLAGPGHPQPDLGTGARRAADVHRTTEVVDSPADRVADPEPTLGSGLG